MSESIELKNAPKKKELVEFLRKTPIVQMACDRAEIARATFYRWKKDDQEFAMNVEEALLTGSSLVNDLAESRLIAAIKDKNFQAIAFWLKHHHPTYTTRVELSLNKAPLNDELSPEEKSMVERALKIVTQPEIEESDKESYDLTSVE